MQSGTLKTALLDYIKRCRPGDSEKHNMIALCFSMCREIGENHEAAANIQLKLIESQSWGELPGRGTSRGFSFLSKSCPSHVPPSRKAEGVVATSLLVLLPCCLLESRWMPQNSLRPS